MHAKTWLVHFHKWILKESSKLEFITFVWLGKNCVLYHKGIKSLFILLCLPKFRKLMPKICERQKYYTLLLRANTKFSQTWISFICRGIQFHYCCHYLFGFFLKKKCQLDFLSRMNSIAYKNALSNRLITNKQPSQRTFSIVYIHPFNRSIKRVLFAGERERKKRFNMSRSNVVDRFMYMYLLEYLYMRDKSQNKKKTQTNKPTNSQWRNR